MTAQMGKFGVARTATPMLVSAVHVTFRLAGPVSASVDREAFKNTTGGTGTTSVLQAKRVYAVLEISTTAKVCV